MPSSHPRLTVSLATSARGRVRRTARRLRGRLLLAAVSGTSALHRRVIRSCWQRPALLREVTRSADTPGLSRLLAALPFGREDDPDPRLIGALLKALTDGGTHRREVIAAAERGADDELRRIVAARLADYGHAELAWHALEAPPRLELSPPRMERIVRELRDPAALDRLLERTTAELSGPDRPRQVVRLHREALLSLGKVAFAVREDADALRWFDRAHEEVGPTVRTWTWRGKALRRLGRLEESRVSGEAAIAERPDWVPALVHLGNLYHQLGDRAASAACWRRVLERPTVSAYHVQRAWNGLVRVGELDLGLAAADRLIDVTGGDPQARAARAVTLWELGRRDEATASIDDLTGRSDAAAIRGLAWFLGRTGDAAKAYRLLSQLPVEQQGTDAVEEIFHMLRRDGHLDLAAEAVHGALAAFPDHHELGRLRRDIDGELQVFRGEWEAPARSVSPFQPVPGRVLHVVGRSVPYASSGYCVRTDHTVRAQQALGIDVHVATQLGFPWEEGRDAPLEESIGGVPHHRLPIPSDARLPLALDERLERHVDALSDLVERLRPAVLHAASDFRNALVGLEVGRRFDLPVVYEMRGFWEETWLAKRDGVGADSAAYRLRRQRETDAASRATHVITLAGTMRDELVDRGIDPARISLAPNAVDAAAFEAAPRDDELATRLGIGSGDVVVGYISSFTGYEGIHVLIDAVARLKADGRSVRCLLVGDGEVRPGLERQSRDLGVEDVVTFTGRVPHDAVRSYYGLIDVFVVPRTNARVCRLVSPLKPYEAMAAGRAIVVSGTPVLRSMIQEGNTGLSFEPEEADDLAARIAELAEDADLREKLGHEARRHVLEHHTWRHNAERYLEVYRTLGVAPLASERTG